MSVVFKMFVFVSDCCYIDVIRPFIALFLYESCHKKPKK